MKGKFYMGLDVGGSKISAALVDTKGQMSLLRRQSTPEDGKLAQDLLIEMGRGLQQHASEGSATIVGVGIGFGGPVDYPSQRVRRSHHTEGWEVNLPLAQMVGEQLGLPTRIDNDANTAALGEALFGAGKGKERILYINVVPALVAAWCASSRSTMAPIATPGRSATAFCRKTAPDVPADIVAASRP